MLREEQLYKKFEKKKKKCVRTQCTKSGVWKIKPEIFSISVGISSIEKERSEKKVFFFLFSLILVSWKFVVNIVILFLFIFIILFLGIIE